MDFSLGRGLIFDRAIIVLRWRRFLRGVVTAAIYAPQSDHVKVSVGFLNAVVTMNISLDIPVFLRHRRTRNVFVNPPPFGAHVDHGDETGRTSVLSLPEELLVALTMKHVTALVDVGGGDGGVEVGEADRAVVVRNSLHAVVVVATFNCSAQSTLVTVEKIIFPADAT